MIYKGPGDTAQMLSLACFSAAHIFDKYQTFLNWPIKFDLSLHLHPFFLVQFAKALARLWQCVIFDVRLCEEYQTHMNWPIKREYDQEVQQLHTSDQPMAP